MPSDLPGIRPDEHPDRIKPGQVVTLGQLGIRDLNEQIQILKDAGFHSDALTPGKTFNAEGPISDGWVRFLQRGLEGQTAVRNAILKLRSLNLDARTLKRLTKSVFWHEITQRPVNAEIIDGNLAGFFNAGKKHGLNAGQIVAHIEGNMNAATLGIVLCGSPRQTESSLRRLKRGFIAKHIPPGTPALVRQHILRDVSVQKVAAGNVGAMRTSIQGAAKRYKPSRPIERRPMSKRPK